MADADQFDDMPITKVVRAWMDGEGVAADIEVGEDRAAARVAYQFIIDDQPHRIFFEIDEEAATFSVVAYSPVNVPPARMAHMARILNRINIRLRLGRLACGDDSNSNPVQFRAGIDVHGGVLAHDQIDSMLGDGLWTMDEYGRLLADAALTEKSPDALWALFIEGEAPKEAHPPA